MDHAFEAGDRLQAFHTNAPLLTPAAYEDFGRIQHFPPSINGRAGRGGLPACRVAPCVDMACQRCKDCRGGHQLPFVARSKGRQSLQRRGRPPQTLGLESIGIQSVYAKWICCASGVDLMRSICSQATFTALLSRMVLSNLTREQCGFTTEFGSKAGGSGKTPPCCLWPVGSWPGATLRSISRCSACCSDCQGRCTVCGH